MTTKGPDKSCKEAVYLHLTRCLPGLCDDGTLFQSPLAPPHGTYSEKFCSTQQIRTDLPCQALCPVLQTLAVTRRDTVQAAQCPRATDELPPWPGRAEGCVGPEPHLGASSVVRQRRGGCGGSLLGQWFSNGVPWTSCSGSSIASAWAVQTLGPAP